MFDGIDPERPVGRESALLSGLADGALFVSSAAVGAAALVLVARTGLVTPWLVLTECVAILVAVAFAPFLLPRSWLDGPEPYRFLVPLPGMALLLAVGLGLFIPTVMAVVLPVSALLAVGRALPVLRLRSAPALFAIFAGGGLLSLYLFAGIYRLPLSHVFGPEFAVAGWYNADAYHHLSIARTIQEFGFPALPADGLARVRYHFGSHVWFAGLASLARDTPLFSYVLGQAIVLIPVLLLGLIQTSLCAKPAMHRMPFHLLFVVGALVFVDAVSWAGWYFSESFTLSLAFLLAGLPLQADLIEVRKRTPIFEALRIGVMYALVLVTLASKVSVGVLLGIGYGWILLRQDGVSIRAFVRGWGLVAVASIGAAFFVPARSSPPEFSFLHIYLTDPPALLGYAPLAPVLVLLPSAIFFFAQGMERWRVGAPLAREDRLQNETVALVTGTALVPGLFFALPALDARWFQEVVPWLVLPTLVFWWSEAALRARSLAVAPALLLVLLMPFDAQVGGQGFVPLSRKLERALAARELHPEGAPARLENGSRNRRAAVESMQMVVGESLRAIVGRARSSRPDRRLLVHLAPEIGAGFRERSRFGCVAWSLWLPSVTGVPMLCAVRPECSALLFYGYSHYFGPGTPTQDCASGDLCALALDRGFDTVLDLRSAFDDGKNRVLDCGEEAAGRRRSGSTQGDGRPGIALGSAFVSLELRPKT